MRDRDYDVAVIGAGITGCAIARVLGRYRLKVVLIDAAEDVAMGATRANSAIVHAGYDCEPGSLMAEMNVRGNAMYDPWCEELQVPIKRTGSLVIAFDAEDERHLRALYERGLINGVPGMELISGDEARALEPGLNPAVTMALHAKTGGITCPYQLTVACAENARANGVQWTLGAPVTGIDSLDDGFRIHAGADRVTARVIVNAAGVYADHIARMIGDESFTIRARKGEYMLLDRTAADIRTVIFQTPSALGKGILVSPTVDGNSFAGPTAVDQQDREDTSVSEKGIEELMRMSRRSVPELNLRSVITSFAGIRAIAGGDFVIRPSGNNPRFIHAAGICSPGLTSAPAIAERVAELIGEAGLLLIPDEGYVKHRRAIREFRHMDAQERVAAIRENPAYGRVICRCETITEAEIVEAIRRGARTVDAVKRRTRAGMGRCQGGFCGPRVMEMLSEQLHEPMENITKFGGDSWMVKTLEEVREGGQ